MSDCRFWDDGKCTAENADGYQDFSEYMNPPEPIRMMTEKECQDFINGLIENWREKKK